MTTEVLNFENKEQLVKEIEEAVQKKDISYADTFREKTLALLSQMKEKDFLNEMEIFLEKLNDISCVAIFAHLVQLDELNEVLGSSDKLFDRMDRISIESMKQNQGNIYQEAMNTFRN